ncbi:MAG: septum formation initiator family protein [Paludibacteraceae bacterium]|nr:septum formation initiator family protein [Paludibacteraceae bacterium]
MEKQIFWKNVRKYLTSKYAIALYVFLLILLFMGDNSLVHYLKRVKKIRAIEEQLIVTKENTKKAQSVLQTLDNADSLERFAREQYRMHAPNEDVYIVEE